MTYEEGDHGLYDYHKEDSREILNCFNAYKK